MFLQGLFSLLARLFFFTGKVQAKNTFDKPLSQKEEKLHYRATIKFAFKLLIPIGFMIIGVLGVNWLFSSIDYNNKVMSIVNIAVSALVGVGIYGGILIKTGTLKKVFGEAYYNKMLRKLTFGKLGK